MKLKNSDLEAMISSPSYRKLFVAEFDDILLVLEIRRQNEDLKPALQAYLDTKKTLIERYCDKDPETGQGISGPGGQFQFTQKPNALQDFQEKFNELQETEVEIEASKVKISTTALKSVSKWSGADMSALYPFVDVFESDVDKKDVTHLKQVPKKSKGK